MNDRMPVSVFVRVCAVSHSHTLATTELLSLVDVEEC
jgi:hypothetical protein